MRATSWARWLLAATLVFQVSASVGVRVSPVETLTAVPLPAHASSGR